MCEDDIDSSSFADMTQMTFTNASSWFFPYIYVSAMFVAGGRVHYKGMYK